MSGGHPLRGCLKARFISTDYQSVILRALSEESLCYKYYKSYNFCIIAVQRSFASLRMTTLSFVYISVRCGHRTLHIYRISTYCVGADAYISCKKDG